MIEFKNVTRSYLVGKDEVKALSNINFKLMMVNLLSYWGPAVPGKVLF